MPVFPVLERQRESPGEPGLHSETLPPHPPPNAYIKGKIEHQFHILISYKRINSDKHRTIQRRKTKTQPGSPRSPERQMICVHGKWLLCLLRVAAAFKEG